MKKVIQVAKNEIGYKETGTNITKYSADFDKNYPDFYNTKKQGAEWCDIFVDWCMVQAYGEENAHALLCQPKKSAGAGCIYSYRYYNQKKQTGKEPCIGSQIFFGKTQSTLSHTGLVIDVSNGKVTTIEGNTGNEVKQKVYNLNDQNIYGYGYPDYSLVSESEPITEPVPVPIPEKKSVFEIVNEILNGKWGNGEERKKKLTDAGYDYYEIQQAVNVAIGANKPKTFIGKVNTDKAPLNVRSGPGTIYPVVRQLAKGSTIELFTQKQGEWFKLTDGSGFVSTKYIR